MEALPDYMQFWLAGNSSSWDSEPSISRTWRGQSGNMHWLDSTLPETADPKTTPGTWRGPCGLEEAKAENAPWTQVKFSKTQEWRDWIDI